MGSYPFISYKAHIGILLYQENLWLMNANSSQLDLMAIQQRLKHYRWQLALKSLIDFTGAAVLIFILSPILIAAALLVKLTSPGPIFFVQKRVGRDGRLFEMLKFRTMYANWDDLPQAEQIKITQASGELVKLTNDPRITPVGRWLRRTSIDELPQLLNVVTGSMSLVGPRPLMPHMLEPYPEFSAIRNLVRPGITGLWQICDRANCTSAEYMIEYDIEYVTTFSVWQDLQILLRSVPAVLTGEGAM